MEQQPNATGIGEVIAPVVPTTSAAARLRPLGLRQTAITGGLWAARRATTRSASIPHAAARLERAGNLTNLRLAAGASGAYAGGNDDSGTTAPFLDSDVHKWLEAVGWELAGGADPELLRLAEPVIDLLARAQRADGYLDSFYQVAHPGQEFTDLQWGHEMYVAGHLAQAAVAWLRSSGDDRLLRITERVVDRIWRELGPGRRALVCGHPEIEMALVELYRATGQARYLELASLLVERRGRGLLGRGRFGDRYWQDHEPVRTAPEPVGHAVRQMYLDCGVVDVAVETGDQELLAAAVRRWEALRASRVYLTGALGSRHRDEAIGAAYELPPDRAYAETCAAIGSAMLAWRLLLATGELRYADLIERTAYNAILSGLGPDGCHFFYSDPLQRRSGGVEVLEGAASTRRAEWFEVSCCPPNIMRFLATFPDQLAAADERGIHLLQLATGSLRAPVPGGSAALRVETAYPWQGDVAIEVTETGPQPWRLTIRVPDWCPQATLTLADVPVAGAHGPGVLALERSWSPGDRLLVRLAMEPRVTWPDPRIDALRHTVALERGPLVYAVEDADLPPGASVEALEVGPEFEVRATPGAVPGLEEAVRLDFDAWIRDDPADAAWPYATRSVSAPGVAPRTATLVSTGAVPYFAWGERPGLGMRVWLPLRPEHPEDDG
jgi:uncharacterized protein